MNLNEGLGLSGKITIDTYRAGFVEAVQPFLTQLQRFRQLAHIVVDVQGEIEQLVDTIDAIRREYHIRTAVECPNLIMGGPGYGLDIIIQRLVGMNTYSLNIMFGEIGTGTTPPALSDTALTTPAKRAAVGFQQDFGQTDAVVQFFFSDSQLANTTYTEFGTFIDGGTTIGTGQLFNHSLLSPSYVKEAGTDTTIQCTINLSNT